MGTTCESKTIYSLAKKISSIYKGVSKKKAIIRKKFSKMQSKEVCNIKSIRINLKKYQNRELFNNEISDLLKFCDKNF